MADPKTVSNLPVDVSIRWAEDQKWLEESHSILSGSEHISSITQKDVSAPAIFSQIDLLLGTARMHPTWAMFSAPKGFHDQRKRIFTSRVLPLFDSDEQMDDRIQKIQALFDQEKELEEKNESFSKQESSKKRTEKDILINMLKNLMELNQNLIFVVSRRNQYQKG